MAGYDRRLVAMAVGACAFALALLVPPWVEQEGNVFRSRKYALVFDPPHRPLRISPKLDVVHKVSIDWGRLSVGLAIIATLTGSAVLAFHLKLRQQREQRRDSEEA